MFHIPMSHRTTHAGSHRSRRTSRLRRGGPAATVLAIAALSLLPRAAHAGPDLSTVSTAFAPGQACPSGTLFSAERGGCAPIVDVREPMRARAGFSPPDLQRIRGTADGHPRRPTDTSLPVPGGIGAGVTYNPGELRVTTSAVLQTTMVVHPEGVTLPNMDEGPGTYDFLFTTATNRTDRTLEVLAVYQNGAAPSMEIFDWSCSCASPCADQPDAGTCDPSVVKPNYEYNKPFTDLSDYVALVPDAQGVAVNALTYTNRSTLQGTIWTNDALFFNHRTQQWDLVYEHSFDSTLLSQDDCTLSGATCGGWGPIMEEAVSGTLPDGGTPGSWPLSDALLPEFGFFDTTLVHDGITSQLSTTETTFTPPPSDQLCYLVPNTSWGVSSEGCPTPPADGGVDAGSDASDASSSDAAADASGSAGCASGSTIINETGCASFPSFNTTGAVCVKVQVNTVNGWNASNVQGRTATVVGASTQGPITPTNGTIANQAGLSAGADGFVYFNFTAGSMAYGSMACW